MSSVITSGYAPRKRAASLDDAPSSPHAYDDEFNVGSALNVKWSRRGNWNDATAIDPYASFSSPTGGRWSHNGFRPSWLMVQPDTSSGTGNSAEIYQSVSLPSECFAWARMSFNIRYNAVVANDARVGLSFHADSSGPDDNNRALIFLNLPGTNTVVCSAGRVQAGVSVTTTSKNVGPQSLGVDSLCQGACYIGIQKLSTTYNFFLGHPNGNWNILASQTLSATIAFMTLTFINASTASPGNMLVGCDFVRFKSGRGLP